MSLTANQKTVLVRVTRATLGGSWYRADGSGERPTLASLYRHGLAVRRTRRGQEGDANAAYEYQVSREVLEAWVGRRETSNV